ncbi:MAG: response regulator [Puniceicoccaceae bacterium]
MSHYDASTYEFHPQNWQMAQTRDGVLFVGNTQGLLEFDGVRWRRHELIPGSSITVLATDEQDRIYAGGRGDFGVIEREPEQGIRFRSLADGLSPADRSRVTTIWNIALTDHGVYFRSDRAVFWYAGGEVQTLPGEFGYLEEIGGRLIAQMKPHGLVEIQQGGVEPIPGTQSLATAGLHAILPWDDEQFLLVNRTDGLLRWDGASGLAPMPGAASEFLKQNRVYRGISLNQPGSVRFALATYNRGVALLDAQGELYQVIDKASGLLDDKSHYVFEDSEGSLWVTQNSGISRLELSSTLQVWDERLGIEGLPHAIARHGESVYAGTSAGLFKLPSSGEPGPHFFVRHEGFDKAAQIGQSTEVWSLVSSGQDLWVGGAGLVHRIRNGMIVQSIEVGSSVYCMLQPEGQTDAWLLGTRRGVAVLRQDPDSQWSMKGMLDSIQTVVWSMIQDDEGRIWMGTPSEGILAVEDLNAQRLQAKVTVYDSAKGLPSGWMHVALLHGDCIVLPQQGLFRFDEIQDRFVHDVNWMRAAGLEPSDQLSHLSVAPNDALWMMVSGKRSGILKVESAGAESPGALRWPAWRLRQLKSLTGIFPESGERVWFLGRDDVLYLWQESTTESDALSGTLETRVRSLSGTRSGTFYWMGGQDRSDFLRSAIPFEDNHLRFAYAATSFLDPEGTQYQVRLLPYDQDWSQWTIETQKDFTRLPGGSYRFQVRARDTSGRVSEFAELALTIKTPWHQQDWARALYVLTGLLLLGLLVQWRIHHYKKRAKQLELLVQERTAAIARQAEELKEMDRIKSHFFANLSHEFRTPLTLILGPVESTLEHCEDAELKRQMSVVRRNAHRLKRLIDQLLYLARLEAKQMQLRIHHGDLQVFVGNIVSLFKSAAEQRGIELEYDIVKPLADYAYFDPDVVEKVCYNLLSNALKFTPEGGTIWVRFIGGSPVVLEVEDTGCGMTQEQQSNLFQRFYQHERSENPLQSGTGIGLALCRELLELHRGSIEVRSGVDKGSTFRVTLPTDIRVFDPESIVKGDIDAELIKDEADSPEREAEPVHALPEVDAGLESDQKWVLIVEDHPQVRDYIREQLQDQFQILEAENGANALELALETIPDLIISDVMMPGMDGFEFCNRLKQDEKLSHIPVMLLTARAGDDSSMEGWQTGADDYLTKPFNAKELRIRVRKLIETRERLRERFRKEGLLLFQSETLPSAEEAFLVKLVSTIEAHLSDENFGVAELGTLLGLSRRQLLRKLQASTGQTATALIRSTRLKKARQLLEAGAFESVTEVAYETGFRSLSYFAKAYREEFGVNPSDV